jgi:hypothetical protein
MTATTHVETEWVQGRRLGRRPHDPNRPVLKLGNYLTGIVPAHPATADYASEITDWGMLGNSDYGDCGPAMVCHARMQITKYLTGVEQSLTTADALALYKLCNPDFDPNTGAGDNGVVLADMLSQALAHGVAGTAPIGYAQVDVRNLDEVRAAIALFGSVMFGVDLDVAQQQQTDRGGPWSYSPSPTWGGHAVLGVAYDSSPTGTDITVVTWGETMGMTLSFEQRQVQEAWVCLWPEHLGSKEFLQGVNLSALAADYEALTGRRFPVQPNPSPQPGPQPVPAPPAVDPADEALVKDLRHWLTEHHTGDNRRAVASVVKWMAAKGLTLAS